MSLTITPTEIATVQAATGCSKEDAKAAIKALVRVRETRSHFTILVIPSVSAAARAVGEYPNYEAAKKHIQSGEFPALPDERAAVIPHYPYKEPVK